MKRQDRVCFTFCVVLPWCALSATVAPGSARAALQNPLDKHPPPTWSWALVQAVPTVQLLAGTSGPRFGVGWQVSPLVWSFGMHRRLSPWRSFVVEPLTRVCGSVELYGGAEILDVPNGIADSGLGRVGIRTYIPVLHRGEYLAVSVGTSVYARFEGPEGMGPRTLTAGHSYEGGIHTLFGVMGFYTLVSPTLEGAEVAMALRVRIF